jgi:hypothetical protein
MIESIWDVKSMAIEGIVGLIVQGWGGRGQGLGENEWGVSVFMVWRWAGAWYGDSGGRYVVT